MARTTPVNSGYNIINGTATGSNKAYVDCWLEWKILNQSVSANTSTVRVLLYAACTRSSTTAWTVAEKYGYVGYDGGNKQYRSTTYNFANYAVNCFGDYTYTISHDSDGTKTVTLEGAWSTSHSTYISGGSVSGSVALTTIDRESTIKASDADIGADSTITVIRRNKGFTHSIAYTFGNLNGYLNSDGDPVDAEIKFTAESLLFSLPESFYDQIPDSQYGIVTLTCKTYSGSTQIGSDQTCTFKAKTYEAECAPEVTGTAVDVNPETLALTGDENYLVRYMSEVHCTITAEAKNGATISQRKIADTVVKGSTLTIYEPQSANIHFEATDSRGYSEEDVVPMHLIPYVMLSISKADIKRTDPTSGNARLELAGKCYSGSFGAVNNVVSAVYCIGGEENEIELTINGSDYSASVDIHDLDYQQSHTIEIVVSDLLTSDEKFVVVGKGIPVFDWGEADFQFHVPVTGDFLGSFRGDLYGTLQGVTIRTVYVSDSTQLRIQTKYQQFQESTTGRQSIFLFGSDNGAPVHGLITVWGNGNDPGWSGTDGISVSLGVDGQVTVNLPLLAWDTFTLLSAEPFTIVL